MLPLPSILDCKDVLKRVCPKKAFTPVKVSLSAHSARRVPLGHDPLFTPAKAHLGVNLLAQTY